MRTNILFNKFPGFFIQTTGFLIFDIRMIHSMYLRQHVEFPEFVSLDVKKMAKDILLPDGLEQYIGAHSPSSTK